MLDLKQQLKPQEFQKKTGEYLWDLEVGNYLKIDHKKQNFLKIDKLDFVKRKKTSAHQNIPLRK